MPPILTRRLGLALGVAAIVVAYLGLVVMPVTIFRSIRYVGDDIIERRTVCGTAYGILVEDRYDPDVPGPSTARDCRGAAWTRLVGNLLIVGVLLAAGIVGIVNGPPRVRPISELPPVPDVGGEIDGRPPRPSPTDHDPPGDGTGTATG